MLSPIGLWSLFYWLARILSDYLRDQADGTGRGTGASELYCHSRVYSWSAERIAHEEDAHEQQPIALIDEELLNYVGSMALGLNDALG